MSSWQSSKRRTAISSPPALPVQPLRFKSTASKEPALSLADSFIESLAVSGVSAETRRRAIDFLRDLRRDLAGYSLPMLLPTPTIGLGPDGLLGFTWESSRWHLNVEFSMGGRFEIFAEDLETGFMWSDEKDAPQISDQLLAQFQSLLTE